MLGVTRAIGLIGIADLLVWLGEPVDAPQHPATIQAWPKVDLPDRSPPPHGSVAVSSVTGEGISELLRLVEAFARTLMPSEDSIALNRRQAIHLQDAADALARAGDVPDAVLIAEELRVARNAFDRLTGHAGVEDVLDALFGRFCLGK